MTDNQIDYSSKFTIQKANSHVLSTAIAVRNKGSNALSTVIIVKNANSKTLSSIITVRKSNSGILSAIITIRKSATKAISSSTTIRKSSSQALSEKLTVRNRSSAGLACSFWLSKEEYSVERINNLVIQKKYTPRSVPTVDAYTTVLEQDVIGYSHFSALVAAGGPNDITYRIQATTNDVPNVWGGIPDQVDKDVTTDDPENAGTFATFAGEFEKIRIQVKNKSAGQNSRVRTSIRCRTSG